MNESKKIISRINRTIGQLESLKKVIELDNYDCSETIIQLKAVVGSMKSLGKYISQKELSNCLSDTSEIEQKEKRIEKVLSAAFN